MNEKAADDGGLSQDEFDKKGIVQAIVFVVVCACVVLAGLIAIAWEVTIIATSTETVATTVGYRTHESTSRNGCDDGVGYDPVIAFTTTDGSPVRAVLSPTSEYCAPPHVGDEITVMYRNTDPTEVQDEQYGPIWAGLAAMIIGGFVLAGGISWLRGAHEARSVRVR